MPYDVIVVKYPCAASWDEMVGTDRVRFCSHCRKRVYNTSEMTREEAKIMLAQREGRPCLRMYRRADGTLVSRECRKAWRIVHPTLGFVIASATALALIFLRGHIAKSRTIGPQATPNAPAPPGTFVVMGEEG